MNALPPELIEDCPSPRCKGSIVRALEIGVTANREVILDPEPATYADGGRFSVRSHQGPVAPGRQPTVHVSMVRNAAQAFGAKTLFRKHADVCGGGSGQRTKSREADG